MKTKVEPKPVIDTGEGHPKITLPGSSDPDDPQQQMIKLFGEVETRLREIDKLLSQAAAGERGAGDAKKPLEQSAAGIAKLVKDSQQQGQQVVEGIDKILELAQQQQGQGGGGSGSGMSSSAGGKGQSSGQGQSGTQGDQESKSPLDGQRDTTTQRENTPDKPGSESGKTQQGAKPDPNGNPRDNKKGSGDPRQTQGKPPPGSETEKAAHGPDSRDNWGYLPEHARDVFRTQGGGAMPARYREWIDSYYRKLNQKP
ncbi:MAG: hypothetical protein IPJ19_20490 [Planctomycetes bacterium]|nr:hypothetical protein [Planctomycetota bacterium]